MESLAKEIKKVKKPQKSKTTQKAKTGTKVVKFFKGVWYELKKVSWPTRKELLQHTSVVISAIALIGLIVWVMDLGFGKILNLIIR